MADGVADGEDVLFRVGVAEHPETESVLSSLAARAIAVQQQISAAVEGVGTRATAEIQRINTASAAGRATAEASTARAGVNAAIGSGGTANMGGATVTGGLNTAAATAAGAQAGREFQTALRAETQRTRPLNNAELDVLFGISERDILEAGAAGGRAMSEALANALGTDRLHFAPDVEIDAQTLTTLEGMASQVGNVTSQIQELDAAGRLNFRQVATEADQFAKALGSLAQGVALLTGDNKDLKKWLDQLLAIKGTVDIFTGLAKGIAGTTRVLSLFTDRREQQNRVALLTAQREQLLQRLADEYNRTLARQTALIGKDTIALNQRAQALRTTALEARAAAGAEQQLAGAAGARGRMPGAAGRGLAGGLVAIGANAVGAGAYGAAGGGIAGQIADTGVQTAIQQLLSRALGGAVGGVAGTAGAAGARAIGGAVGGGAAGAAGGVVGGAGGAAVAGSAGLLATVGAAAAALGALALVGKELHEVFSGTANQVGSVTDTIASWEVRTADWFGDLTGLFDLVDSKGADKAEELAKKNAEKKIQEELTSKLGLVDKAGDDQLADRTVANRARSRAALVSTGDVNAVPAAQMGAQDAAQMLGKELKIVSDYQKGITHDTELYVASLKRSDELTKAAVTSQEAIIAAVKQESAERQKLNNDSISASQARMSQLEREKGIFQSNESKLESAAAKFARMSEAEQTKVLKAKEAADRGETLTRKQRASLDSLGLGAESEFTKKQDLADAHKAGFFNKFGSFEQAQMQDSRSRLGDIDQIGRDARNADAFGTKEEREARLRDIDRRQLAVGDAQSKAAGRSGFDDPASEQMFAGRIQQVKVEIADRKDFNIKLEQNEKEVARIIAQQINQFQAGAEERMKKLIEEERLKSHTGIMKQANIDAAARRAKAEAG